MQKQQNSTAIGDSNRRLARQNAGVLHVIDQIVYHVDQIVEDAEQGRWENVARMSKVIADECERSGYDELGNAATRLSHAARHPDDEKSVSRSLIKLVGAVGCRV